MTTTTMFRTLRATTLLLVTSAITLSAQESSTTSSGANCDRAARGVLEKPLPEPGTDGWNHFMELTSCGSRGATVIAGVLQSPMVRAEMDVARLDALAGMLDGWFSPTLVSAYEQVVAAPQASPAMRVRTMWLLSGLLAPTMEVAGPLQGYTAASCGAYERVTALRNAPNALPQQAYDDARLAFARAASDPSAPDAVRSTARCWSDAVMGRANAGGGYVSSAQSTSDDRVEATPVAATQTTVNQTTVVVDGPPPITVIEPIEVRYECDGRFVIYNQGPALMNLRYEVVGAGWGGMMQVGGRGSHVFVAARVGPLRFYVGSREVAYVRYVRRSCYDWHDRFTVVVASRMYYPPPVYLAPRPVVVVRPRPRVEVIPPRGRVEVVPPRGRGGDGRPRVEDHGNTGNGGNSGRTAQPRGGHVQEAVATAPAGTMSAPRTADHMRRPVEAAPQGGQSGKSAPPERKGNDHRDGDRKDEGRSAGRRP